MSPYTSFSKKNKCITLLAIILAMAIGLAGCQSDATPTPQEAPASRVEGQKSPAAEPTPVSVEASPTRVVAPTPTPIPIPSPITIPDDIATPLPTPQPSATRPTGTPTSAPTTTLPPITRPTAATIPAPTETPPPPIPATRESSLEEDAASVAALVNGNTAFAIDLYKTIGGSNDNIFMSPYSISIALAMALGGARGETESQMARTLRFALPQNRLHPVFKALQSDLALLSSDENSDSFKLNIVNSVWGQREHGFLPEYLGILALNYGNDVREVDFRANPQDARRQINDWVTNGTAGRINDLIGPDAIDHFTRLVLANAVFFRGEWENPFDERATSRKAFFSLDGTENRVEMMGHIEDFAYTRGANYQAVEMPYKGEETSMVILLPDEGKFVEFENTLDPTILVSAIENLETRPVRLIVPKFELDFSLPLVDHLKTMGMPNAFDEKRAEFQGMDGLSCLAGDNECLHVSDVVHKAFVSVDEAGTEATAATAVIVDVVKEAETEEPIVLSINRPFIFLIRDKQSGSILFLGRVVTL